MNDFAITVVPSDAAAQAQARKALITHLRSHVLLDGHDFGTIPGTAKPTLYKAGAERLCAALELSPTFEITNRIEVWDEASAMFHYETLCRLIHIPSGREVATAMGSCNSMESRYRWRWVAEADVPHWLDLTKLKTRTSGVFEFDFAIKKRETSGKYGKPAEYWAAFDAAIEDGTARRMSRKTSKGESQGWEIGGIEYRIPNDEIFSLTNTILKMSNKRAFVSAVLIASNASEFFTVDIEDLHDVGLVGYGAPTVTVERPADPVSVEPELVGFNLEWVTRSLTKKGSDYYRFNDTDSELGNVYTFTRDPFRAAGLDVDAWAQMPLDQRHDMRPFSAVGYAVKKGEGRFELASVEVLHD